MAQKTISHEELVCDTCLKGIEFLPVRAVIMRNQEGKTLNLHFHYFFPCWDFEYLCQKYPEYDLVKMGFIYDSDYLTASIIRNIRKNEDLWV